MAFEGVPKRVRSVYGQLWVRPDQRHLIPRKTLEKIAKTILDSIIMEGKKDLAKQGNRPTPEGKPEGLPVTEKFWRSFSYKIKGQGTIEIYCSWPVIDQILGGRARFSMDWLRQDMGVRRVPIEDPEEGTVWVATPGFGQESWVHPGFRKHTFIERGIRKARAKNKETLARQVFESTFKR